MLFEKATKGHFRFQYNGTITAEDLWDLDLDALNIIGTAIIKELKAASEESLIAVKSKGNKVLELKLDIIKRVIEVKLEDEAKSDRRANNKRRKEKLLEAISAKQDAALESKSMRTLLAEYEALEEEDED